MDPNDHQDTSGHYRPRKTQPDPRRHVEPVLPADAWDDVIAQACETGDFTQVQQMYQEELERQRGEIVCRLMEIVLADSNPLLALQCLGIAGNLTSQQYKTLSSIAMQHGISRSAVSQRVRALQVKFNLHSRRCWTAEDRDNLSKVKKEYYAKRKGKK